MHIRVGRRVIALIAAAGLTVLACGSQSSQGSSGPIKIGVTAPLTGPDAKPGQDIVNAAKLVAGDINNAGGAGGRKLQIIPADDQCDAQVGVQAAQNLVNQGVVALVGGYCSGASIPESTVVHRNGNLPFLTVASSNPKFSEQGFNDLFRLIMRDDWEGPVDAGFLVKVQGKKRVAVLHDNTTYARGLAEYVRDALPKSGGQAVYYDALTPGQKDYTSTLTKISGENPDALVYTGYYAEGAVLAKEWKQLGLSSKFLYYGGGALFDPAFLAAAGSSADGMFVPFPPSSQLVSGGAASQFKSSYRKAYNMDPGAYAIYEHDALHIFADSVKAAGGTDAKKLNEALRKTSYDGLTGKVTFDRRGDRVNMPINVHLVQNGQFVEYAKHQGAYQGGSWVKSS